MKKWKVSICIGAMVGVVPLLVGLIMFNTSYSDDLTRVIYPLFALGLPGMLFEGLIMSTHEPHGGGTPLEMLLIVLPLNIAFYSVVTYALIRLVTLLIRAFARETRDRSV